MSVHRVDAARSSGQLELASEHLTPLVGRTDEIETLSARWAATVSAFRQGVGPPEPAHLVLVGEPGVGKSRLARLLRDRVVGDGGLDLLVSCADRSAPSLDPVRGAFERLLGVRPDDAPDAALTGLAAHFGDTPELLAQLASALELPTTPDQIDPGLAPSARREATLDALLDAVAHLARTCPVLVLVEDGHWADPTTLEWVKRLVARATLGVQLVVVSRPTTIDRWARLADVIEIEPLPTDDVRELIRSAADGLLPQTIIDTVVSRSDGIPLFAEQLARTMTRGGADTSPTTEVPRTLQDLLQSQLDAAGQAKGYAQVAASVGRDFDVGMLFRVIQRLAERAGEPVPNEDDINGAMTTLAHLDLVVPTSAGGRRLRFRHALVRDAAYDSQLLSERPDRHLAIAEELAGGTRDLPATVAFHFDWGGDARRAIDWYLRASADARSRGEFDEGLSRLGRADELLGDVGPAERPGFELRIRTERGINVSNTHGWAAPEVVDEFSRCVELCKSVDDTGTAADLVRALSGLWSYWISEGDMDRCQVVGRQLIAQLEKAGAGGRVATIQSIRGTESFWTGRFPEARTALHQAADLYDHGRFNSSEWGLAHDLLVAVQSLLGPLLVIMGDEQGGLALLNAGVDRAASLAPPTGPFSDAYVRAYRAWVCRMRGDLAGAVEEADRVVEVGRQRGFAEWMLVGALHQAAALVTARDWERACIELDAALTTFRSLGGGTGSTLFLVDLADAQRHAGRCDDAADSLDDALRLARDRSHGVHVAETHRSRAELSAAMNGPDHPDVTASIDAALAVADDQGAVLWGVRAATVAQRLVPGHRPADVEGWIRRGVQAYGPDSPLLAGPASR